MVNRVIKNVAASLWSPKVRYIVHNIPQIFFVLRVMNILYFIVPLTFLL